jgi:hypothetical protein
MLTWTPDLHVQGRNHRNVVRRIELDLISTPGSWLEACQYPLSKL